MLEFVPAVGAAILIYDVTDKSAERRMTQSDLRRQLRSPVSSHVLKVEKKTSRRRSSRLYQRPYKVFGLY